MDSSAHKDQSEDETPLLARKYEGERAQRDEQYVHSTDRGFRHSRCSCAKERCHQARHLAQAGQRLGREATAGLLGDHRNRELTGEARQGCRAAAEIAIAFVLDQLLCGVQVDADRVGPDGLRQPRHLVDAGVLLPGINHDFAGAAPDIGAYELSPK